MGFLVCSSKAIVKIVFFFAKFEKKKIQEGKKREPFELHMAWKSQGNVLDGFSRLALLKVVF